MKTYVRQLRKDHNLSQSQFAEILGVTQGVVSSWEIGRTDIDTFSLVKMSVIFNVSIQWILTGKGYDGICCNEDEIQLLRNFRILSKDFQDNFKRLIAMLPKEK